MAHNTTIIMYNNLKRAKCQGVIATHDTKIQETEENSVNKVVLKYQIKVLTFRHLMVK